MALPKLENYGIKELLFHEDNKSKPVAFKDLPALEWVLTSSRVRIQVSLIDPKKNHTVKFSHHYAGKEKHSKELKVKSGDAFAKCSMPRGRNTFVFENLQDSNGEPFEIDVFFKGRLRNWIEPFIKIAIIFVIIQGFIIKAFHIPTGSMMNTLFPGDYLLVERVSLLFSEPKAGEITVFQYPNNFTQDFIKRLIGMPGDILEMKNKILYINGVKEMRVTSTPS